MALALLATACARGPAPVPGPPSLDGHRVMILPVRAGDPPELDAELSALLPEWGPATDWIPAEELQRMLDRAPAWRVRLNAMPRHIADAGGRAPRILDPAYGDLRRLGAIADALVALMPVAVREVPLADGEGVALELDVALVEVRGGRVAWLRTVRGEAADGSRAGAAAAVAEALARTLFPR
jgi:hypothetical protein